MSEPFANSDFAGRATVRGLDATITYHYDRFHHGDNMTTTDVLVVEHPDYTRTRARTTCTGSWDRKTKGGVVDVVTVVYFDGRPMEYRVEEVPSDTQDTWLASWAETERWCRLAGVDPEKVRAQRAFERAARHETP